MPIRKRTLIDAPLAIGVPEVMVPADNDELKPTPFGWLGGCSNVVPCTVTVQGGVKAAAAQVVESFTPATTTASELLGLRSAYPVGAGKVVMSSTRKRMRVTLPPVSFRIRRRISSVPKVELLAGSLVKSRTLFGLQAALPVLSRALIGNSELR